jgi:hypothetical protein
MEEIERQGGDVERAIHVTKVVARVLVADSFQLLA